MINVKLLVPRRQIFNAIGSMCKSPGLLLEDTVNFKVGDFEEGLFKIIYSAINNMVINNPGITEITAIDIDSYLSQHKHPYQTYEENKGKYFLDEAIKLSNPDLFFTNYDVIKKFALLRDFNNMGFDISDIYNPESLDSKLVTDQAEKLEKMKLDDIIDHFNLKLINLQNDWNIDGNKKTYAISDGLDDLLEELSKRPDYGYPFMNSIYNTIFRGMRFGKLMIKSAGTGVGKTRTALTDIAAVSASALYNLTTEKYEENGATYASTFISTELDKQDLQTCLLAIISGVNEAIIKKGNYSPDIKTRLERAIEILKESPITLHYINDFSIGDIEKIIEKDILEKNSKFIFFDYLQMTPKLARTIQEEYGMGLREDQVMLNFTSKLRQIAEKYNVYISTATQLNRNSKERENRDATAVRGGSSQIDKADHAVQLYRVTNTDLAKVTDLVNRSAIEPNFMHIIYKNRAGQNNIIIWTKLNHGNMREEYCFCTDLDYNLIDISPTEIKFSE